MNAARSFTRRSRIQGLVLAFCGPAHLGLAAGTPPSAWAKKQEGDFRLDQLKLSDCIKRIRHGNRVGLYYMHF